MYLLLTPVFPPVTPDKPEASLGFPLFSGVSPPFFGVPLISTSLSHSSSSFPGVTLKLLLFLVYTRFSSSSSHFSGGLAKTPNSPAVTPDSPGVPLTLSAVFEVFMVAPFSHIDIISLQQKSSFKEV